MVNGKVLHLESSPPARIFKTRCPGRLDYRAIGLCVPFVLFVSLGIMSGDQLILQYHFMYIMSSAPGRSQTGSAPVWVPGFAGEGYCVKSPKRHARTLIKFIFWVIQVIWSMCPRPASLPTPQPGAEPLLGGLSFSLSPLFVSAAVAHHQQRCARGQSPSLSSLAAAHH